MIATLQAWDLEVELGEHALDQWGFMAGTDEDRLADLNDAFRDPGVRAVFATRGGAGAYRIVDGLDLDAVRADPKPLVGFSDITSLHLALWSGARVASVHGCVDGPRAARSTRALLMQGESLVLHRDTETPTGVVSVDGTAVGPLLGGNLRTLAGAVGAGLPSLEGAVVLLEDERIRGLGQVDRELTQLRRSGALDGIVGIALGSCPGFEGYEDRGWRLADVLDAQLGRLGIPILGGLHVGHVTDPFPAPLGVDATLNSRAGTLSIQACVE